MKNGIEAMITDITATTAEAEDYTGEDGLLYCGKCHTPKEAYFAEGKTCFGRDRHPAECDCQRAAREKQQAAAGSRGDIFSFFRQQFFNGCIGAEQNIRAALRHHLFTVTGFFQIAIQIAVSSEVIS